ncbi:MAG: response regulator [Bacteroidota bacterium]
MAGSSKKMLSILVIEDNQADVEMIRIFLQDSKPQHQLLKAESLSEGFYLLEEHDIDLVLLDLNLPDTNGFNTLRRFLQKSPGVPVVVMTGLADQRKGTESVRAGAQDYLVKGEFDGKQLLKAIRYSLERFRLQAEAEERATKASDEQSRLKALQQMAALGDWEMDIVSLSMEWSEEVFQIFQVTPNSFSPSLSDYLGFVHREDREKVEKFFAEAVKYQEYGPLEHRILIDNRILKTLSMRTRIRFDEKANRILLLGSVQDLTPSSAESAPVDDPPTDESQSDPFYSRELFNQISFNIRTPLSTAVHLFYLLEQTALNKHQSKLVRDLKTTIDDLSFTLSNLVNLSILSNDSALSAKEQFRPLDILESIQRVMTFKGQQNNREIDIYIDPRLAVGVQGDSNKLSQLFFCLVELAFLYSKMGAFVKLRCTWEEEETGNGVLEVQLEYDGGLPQWPSTEADATAEEVFSLLQPRQKTKGREELLARVFQRLCDQLEVRRREHRGQAGVFVDLSIPLKRTKGRDSDVPSTPQQDLRILLVEDHPLHQIATKKVLHTWSEKVQVTVVGNGKEALVRAQEMSFDLVLMDLQMPEMGGIEAATNLRLFSPVPIIALTASTSKQEEDQCYQAGINDYLAKPFQPEDLYRRIMLLVYEEEKV